MEKGPVNFDMKKMEELVPAFVRARAIKAGSYVIYMKNNQLIQENPRTGERTILKDKSSKVQ
jgi:hypothetical protein